MITFHYHPKLFVIFACLSPALGSSPWPFMGRHCRSLLQGLTSGWDAKATLGGKALARLLLQWQSHSSCGGHRGISGLLVVALSSPGSPLILPERVRTPGTPGRGGSLAAQKPVTSSNLAAFIPTFSQEDLLAVVYRSGCYFERASNPSPLPETFHPELLCPQSPSRLPDPFAKQKLGPPAASGHSLLGTAGEKKKLSPPLIRRNSRSHSGRALASSARHGAPRSLIRWIRADSDLTVQWAEWWGKKPEKELPRKVVWVTGASSGIGEELAYQLAKIGSWLVLSARRENELERVKKKCLEISSLSDKDILILPLDLTERESHESATKTVLQHFGRDADVSYYKKSS
ncbi:dehydrogenase/reductase SDR family member 7 [Crotalus adamanteus]|uniref:Dehydrogenase/reductase SDR family member 7 n=1 Tax=Crotalus adamanteus TaxID=8729 RepID=A0AAW1C6G9_CROAD